MNREMVRSQVSVAYLRKLTIEAAGFEIVWRGKPSPKLSNMLYKQKGGPAEWSALGVKVIDAQKLYFKANWRFRAPCEVLTTPAGTLLV
jgi:hypothetical protein